MECKCSTCFAPRESKYSGQMMGIGHHGADGYCPLYGPFLAKLSFDLE